VPANVGEGQATLQGSLNAEFAQDTSGLTQIKYWKTYNYPAQYADSALSGVRFSVSTDLPEENPTISGVKFSFKLRVVPGSSSWFRVDYSINGGNSWTTARPAERLTATFLTESYFWSAQFTVAVINQSVIGNPNLVFRVVSVFSPEAFTEYFSNTAFLNNQGYESSRNVLGGSQNAAYVSAAPWGFEDVKVEYISIASSSIVPCRTQRFIRSQSGCFATEEDCRQHFIEYGPFTEVEFLADVNCAGSTVPINSPEMPSDFCIVPDKKKLCPQWTCGCCGPTVACCTVEDFDSPCPETPICNQDECCDPPPPEFCCCITIVDGCTTSKSCVGFVPGEISGIDGCSDFNVLTETNQTYCVQVSTCDQCTPDDSECNVGILFNCNSSCGNSVGFEPCPENECCNDCFGYDPITNLCIDIRQTCYTCLGSCGLGNNSVWCCTAECVESGGYGSCQGWSCPGSDCGGPLDCRYGPDGPCGVCERPCLDGAGPGYTIEQFPMTCEHCTREVLGLCYTGNCPPWIWGLTMGFEESAAEKDLTKGIVFDKTSQPALNTVFLFGYGENRL
jgi:hypothetical protein